MINIGLQSLLGELRKKVVDGAKETADTRQLIRVSILVIMIKTKTKTNTNTNTNTNINTKETADTVS